MPIQGEGQIGVMCRVYAARRGKGLRASTAANEVVVWIGGMTVVGGELTLDLLQVCV